MAGLAVIATLFGGFIAATWEPELGTITAIAIMGGFILNEFERKGKKNTYNNDSNDNDYRV